MIAVRTGAYAVFETLYQLNGAVFDHLVAALANRPSHGEVTIRFRDGVPFIVERHETFR